MSSHWTTGVVVLLPDVDRIGLLGVVTRTDRHYPLLKTTAQHSATYSGQMVPSENSKRSHGNCFRVSALYGGTVEECMVTYLRWF